MGTGRRAFAGVSGAGSSVRDDLPDGLSFRPLVPADYDFVIAHLDEWWGGRHVAPALPRLFFDHFHETGIAVGQGSELAGFLLGFLSPAERSVAYIHFVGVAPAWRRDGVARAMYERFFELAAAHGRTSVRCLTSPVNTASIAFHRALGFELESGNGRVDGIPVHLDHDGPGEHRVLFVRRLAPHGHASSQTETLADRP